MKKFFAVAVAMFSAATAHAALVGRDINGIAVAGNAANAVFLYDTVLDITWLRNANVNGLMTWAQANAWAAGLTVGSYGGWRLPTLIATPNAAFAYSGTDFGWNVRTTSGGNVYSELASLYYDTLGNKAYYNASGSGPQPVYGLVNKGDFQNLQGWGYWLGLEYAPIPTSAWFFDTNYGNQDRRDKIFSTEYALAVRSGDVAPAAVPIPAAAWLMLSGIGALGVASRRRQPLVNA